jgi:hypothetical protein
MTVLRLSKIPYTHSRTISHSYHWEHEPITELDGVAEDSSGAAVEDASGVVVEGVSGAAIEDESSVGNKTGDETKD